MRANGAGARPARMAARLLLAAEHGNLPSLEVELTRAERLAASSQAGLAAGAAERFELLGAVASHMRQSLRRFRGHSGARLDDLEIDLRLLKHLARST